MFAAPKRKVMNLDTCELLNSSPLNSLQSQIETYSAHK